MFAASMPKARTFCVLVDSATKCFATCAASPHCFTNHALAVSAFMIVSCVVNVLLAMMNSVDAASTRFSTSARCVPSTLDTKCTRGPTAYGRSASVTMSGPRSLPPMPMLTTSAIGAPV